MCVCLAKQAVRVFDGDDAVKRGAFRLVSVPRVTRKEELVVRRLMLPLSPRQPALHPSADITVTPAALIYVVNVITLAPMTGDYWDII